MFQLRWVWHNLKGYRGKFLVAVAILIVGNAMVIINPSIQKKIVDEIVIGNVDAAGNVIRDISSLLPLLITMLSISVFRSGIFQVMVYLLERSSMGMIVKIKNHIYENLQVQEMEFYDKNPVGDLMTRLTGDMDMVRHAVAWIVKAVVESSVMFIASLIYFLIIDPLFTLVLLAFIPFIFFVTRKFSKQVRPKYIITREKLSRLNINAQENISGNRVVKAFAREEFENEKFDDHNREYKEANLDAAFTWLKYYPIIEFLAQSLSVIIIVVGGLFIILGRLTFGELLAFSALSWTLANPMRMLGMVLNDIQRFFASANKVIEIYYAKPRIVNPVNAFAPSDVKGEVEFKNVSFRFGKEQVFENVSFTVSPGETVALMGGTGCGKTSLINLIPRFYDISAGEVCVDGINVRKWDLKTLRRSIGIATQEVFLFSDTVDGNIAYGKEDLSVEDVRYFASSAAADFIDKMEEGYDTIIGERGVGLSGGQKQRIALARALAIRPRILILDDTTSAVDMETEKYIQSRLAAMDFQCTKFIIAQRISSAQKADKIIILNEGKIVEMGTHKELLALNGYYREIYDLQNEGLDSPIRKGAM